MNPLFYIKTFGCQMNVADSERIAAILSENGMKAAAHPEEANIIIVNGCTVRDKAAHKAASVIGEFNLIKRQRKAEGDPRPLWLGMGGCVGQDEKKRLIKRAPYIDFVFGTDAIDQLPEILFRLQQGERHVVATEFDRSLSYSTSTKLESRKTQAFVNIMKGCDKRCTYCIVPFTRGREKSRRIQEVVEDVARLVSDGVREITLLGQNVNSFGKGNPNDSGREPRELNNQIGKVGPKAGEENFPQLLRALDQDPRCEQLKRIRFTSSHPLDFSDELLECYASQSNGGISRLSPHLHLPVQSGSNSVLERMGRYHQIETYIDQMKRLREISPDVGLSTDLIVGFPGETAEDFRATLKLLDQVQYDSIYAFAYSPRPGTRAALMVDDVSDLEKNERLNQLLDYQLVIAEARYASRVGKVMEILIEGEARNQGISTGLETSARVWTGRTGCNRVVNFTAPDHVKVGQFALVKITKSTSLSLQGEFLEVIP